MEQPEKKAYETQMAQMLSHIRQDETIDERESKNQTRELDRPGMLGQDGDGTAELGRERAHRGQAGTDDPTWEHSHTGWRNLDSGGSGGQEGRRYIMVPEEETTLVEDLEGTPTGGVNPRLQSEPTSGRSSFRHMRHVNVQGLAGSTENKDGSGSGGGRMNAAPECWKKTSSPENLDNQAGRHGVE